MTKLNARSPYYIKVDDVNLSYATLQLYIYTGVFTTDKPVTAQYTITKSEIASNNFVIFEIAELVRDYLDISFNQEFTEDLYKARVLADGGTFEGSSCLSAILDTLDDDFRSQTVWVEADITLYNSSDASIGTSNTDYLAFDGYAYFTDGTNAELSRTLLQSNTDIYVENGERVQVPVYTDKVTSVQFYNGGVLHTTETITSSTNSNAQIKYAGSSLATDEIRVISSAGTETINVYQIDECRYTPYRVTFVNKFGALQNLYFFKKSIENINTTTENYKANTFNQNTLDYDIQSHQYKQFQKAGRESITMNTGYVSEEYNEVMKQLLLSEQVWMTKTIDTRPTILPVNVKTQSLQYKTSVNDKLINYTIDFDYAFDKINNIR